MGTLVDVLLSTNMSKSSSILFLVVAASWLVCVQSQKVFFGSCPNVATEENFDMSQYAKVWYENRKYCAIFQLGQRCVIANYTDNSDGTYGVTNSGLAILFNLPVSVDATLQAVSNTTGELHVSYSGTENAPTSGNYLVLDTDYTGYSILELYRLRIIQFSAFVDIDSRKRCCWCKYDRSAGESDRFGSGYNFIDRN